jgi:uncharacterized membrane protein
MMKIIAAGIILLLILRNVYSVIVGMRDGVMKRQITAPGVVSERNYEGHAALRYGWFSIIGGLALTLLGLWALWTLVND